MTFILMMAAAWRIHVAAGLVRTTVSRPRSGVTTVPNG
jgi:hypothetical protein